MKARGFLIDLDGVLYTGDRAIPGAQETIRFLQEQNCPFRCVSNSTRKCRSTIAQRLAKMGIEIPESFIFTPPLAAMKYITGTGKNRLYLLTTGDVVRDFSSLCSLDDQENVDYVIVGDAGDRLNYGTLNRAFRHLLSGAELIALEKDRFWMAPDGLSLSAGPFVAALEYAAGTTARVMGKPAKDFFSLALHDMGLIPHEAAMIGDDIATDIGGAQQAGLAGILVKTGKFRKDTLMQSNIMPDAVIGSIANLKEIM